MKQAHFLTVSWCNSGERGIFCDREGHAFRKKNGEAHSPEEMRAILGPFWLILNPESKLLTEDELAEYNHWVPLAEYKNEYGIVMKVEDIPIRGALTEEDK